MFYLGVPTVNNLNYLHQTLDSIQGKSECKTLIVDNGSTDGTHDWLKNEDKPHQVDDYIINGSNVGVAKAWNQILNWGLSHADCEAIFILNNDIVLHPKSFDNMVSGFDKYDSVSGVNIGNKTQQLKSWSFPTPRYNPAMNFSCFAVKPVVVKRIGFFDEGFKLAYFEDNDYHHRMNLDGVSNACDVHAPFIHYGSRSIKEGGVKHEPHFTNNRNYFRQKWGFSPDGH